MFYISKWKCQARRPEDGKVITYKQGAIVEFEETPSDNWEPLDDAIKEVDFKIADRDLLMASKLKFKELADFCMLEYGEELPKLDGKEAIVEKFLDIRYRSADVAKV